MDSSGCMVGQQVSWSGTHKLDTLRPRKIRSSSACVTHDVLRVDTPGAGQRFERVRSAMTLRRSVELGCGSKRALRKEVKIIVNSLVVQPWTLRLGPVVLVGVVLRRPSRVRREAVVDELPRKVGPPRRGASRSEETRAGVAPRRERRRHRGRRGARHRRAHIARPARRILA